MAGNSRSGRRPKPPAAVREGKPGRPDKLTADEAFFWTAVIEQAAHLEAIDTPMCHAVTRAWGLYCRVCVLASKDPTDKDIKSAVSTYGTLLDKLAARLALDPLGRVRHKPKRAEELDPLQAFMAGHGALPARPTRRRTRPTSRPCHTRAKGRKK